MINNTQKQIKLANLYYNAMLKTMSKFKIKELTKEENKKILFYRLRLVNFYPKTKDIGDMELKAIINIANMVKAGLSLITPIEFENMFPIEKIYDGERYCCKDYFYTKKYLGTLPPDKPIGDYVEEFLWEYVNPDIRKFNISFYLLANELRKRNGKKDIMQEWAELNGITTYSLKKDLNGKEYLYDNKNRRTIKLKKKVPHYLRLINKS